MLGKLILIPFAAEMVLWLCLPSDELSRMNKYNIPTVLVGSVLKLPFPDGLVQSYYCILVLAFPLCLNHCCCKLAVQVLGEGEEGCW